MGCSANSAAAVASCDSAGDESWDWEATWMLLHSDSICLCATDMDCCCFGWMSWATSCCVRLTFARFVAAARRALDHHCMRRALAPNDLTWMPEKCASASTRPTKCSSRWSLPPHSSWLHLPVCYRRLASAFCYSHVACAAVFWPTICLILAFRWLAAMLATTHLIWQAMLAICWMACSLLNRNADLF